MLIEHLEKSKIALMLAVLFTLFNQTGFSHPDDAGVVEAALHTLVDQGAISEAVHNHLDKMYSNGHTQQLAHYLNSLVQRGEISSDILIYLQTLFRISTADGSGVALAAAPASYSGNGNVTLLGQLNPRAPFVYYSDNTSTGQLYEGIWGYAAGGKEYALLTHSQGLSIIDATNPYSPVELQFIPGVGGRVHHDVDTYYDTVSGKTYAYFGGQEGEHLYSIDLSYLPGTIPASGIVDLGRTNYAHTLQVKDGLLFTNNAGGLGCQVFDVQANPANPPLLAQSWTGSGRDCHDSFMRNNILYSSDGFSTRWRIVDITSIRNGVAPMLLGETAPKSGVYAHSDWLSDDSRYLFTFEELNVQDINVFDVSNPANPVNVKTFQWSGDATANSIVHNGQVKGNLLYVAYYEAGFRVFDITDPTNPIEVGKYETWRDPDGDGTFNKSVTGNYNGAWNVYTQLPSGNILVSDMLSGLFIFQVSPPDTPVIPPAPTGLSATPGDGKVDLSWGSSSGATSYNVKRSTASGGPYATISTGVTGVTYTDASVANSTTYYYVVSAVNIAGESQNSIEASATPTGVDTAAPSQPTGLSAASGPAAKQISLSWNASTDNVGVTGYEVWRASKQNGRYSLLATPVSDSYVDKLPKSGTLRWYYIIARDAAGNRSQASATVSGTAK